MKSRIAALVAAFFLCSVGIASAMDRVTEYFGANPASTTLNQESRDVRIGVGSFMWNVLCGASPTCAGAYANLSVVPVSGLYVAVSPTTASTVGTLYQFLPEDTSPYGGFPAGVGTFLAADATQVMLQGTITNTLAQIGPLNPPTTTGQSLDYLIECKVITQDANPQTIQIVSPGGTVTSSIANRDRQDTMSCQSKAGTAAVTGSQTVPAADAFYIPVGFVAVPYGTTTITSGMTGASTLGAYYGAMKASALGANGVALSPTSQQTGGINVSGGGTFGNSLTVGSQGAGVGTNAIFIGNNLSGSTNINTNYTLSTQGTYCTLLGVAYLGVEQLCLDSNGNMGVMGAVSTTNSFQCTATSSVCNIHANSGSYVAVQGNNTTIGVDLSNANASSAIAGFVNSTGTRVAYITNAGTLTTPSDRRLKKNIKPLSYGLSTIDALRPVSFDWRSTGAHSTGLIAQEVQRVLPSAVHVNPHKPGETQYLGVSYSDLIPVLVKAIQQQQTEINQLKKRLRVR